MNNPEEQMEETINNEPAMSFEEALGRLESIVFQLEKGSLPLEESIAAYEEGMRMSKFCAKKLAEAEAKVQMLVKQTDGNLAWVDYVKPQQ